MEHSPSFLLLYLSRALAAWGDRTWQFMGGLFMLQIDGSKSLQLVAVYGLVSCLALLVLGNALGRLVDTRPRDQMIRSAVLTQNISVSVTCAVLALYFGEVFVPSSTTTVLISGTALLLYTTSYLSSVAARISVEKDWIVCLCEDDTSTLARVNTNVRTIDLVCNLLAPTLAGVVIERCSYFVAALILVFWVLLSASLELVLLMQVYKKNSRLQDKAVAGDEAEAAPCYKNFSGWKTYFTHHVREAGLGLAMLYMTVLGFDNITWGYCYHQGVSESVLGALTALSALVGVAGARVFPLLARKVGLTTAGLLGFTLQSCLLAVSVSSVWAPGSPFSPSAPDSQSHLESTNHDQVIPNQYVPPPVSPTTNWRLENNQTNITITSDQDPSYVSVTLLLVGIISSRFGLWIADLSVHQIFQEEILEDQRGAVCGVQAGLQSLMDLIKFILVFFIPHQNTFGVLIILSYLFVTAGGLFFFRYKLKSAHLPDGETDKLIQ